MRKVSVVFLAVVLMLSVASFSYGQGSSLKIAYVNLSGIFDSYYKTGNYDKTLEKKNLDYQKERNRKIEKIQEADRRLVLLKPDERAKLVEQINKDKKALEDFDRKKLTDLRKERDEKVREILLEIEEVIKSYAQKEKYDVILNDRVLIYGNQTLDLTTKILDILNVKKK